MKSGISARQTGLTLTLREFFIPTSGLDVYLGDSYDSNDSRYLADNGDMLTHFECLSSIPLLDVKHIW